MPDENEESRPTAEGHSNIGGASTPLDLVSQKEFKNLADRQKSDRNLLLGVMVGVVVVVVVTFLVDLSAAVRSYIQDKSILLQNNQLNKDYFDKVLLLNNEIQDIKGQLDNSKAAMEGIKSCVQNFGFTSRCFK